MTLHITNWSSRALHGPGRKYTIMAMPRDFERGDGPVATLAPDRDDLAAVRAGGLLPEDYRGRFLAHIAAVQAAATYDVLASGGLKGHVHGTVGPMPVVDGDTLCCACSREAAARGECHRVWAAELLRRAGWQVVLDGKVLAGVDASWAPVWEGRR